MPVYVVQKDCFISSHFRKCGETVDLPEESARHHVRNGTLCSRDMEEPQARRAIVPERSPDDSLLHVAAGRRRRRKLSLRFGGESGPQPGSVE